jgi:hypothetical protein
MESASRTGPVHYRTAAVGGVNVFYREAGPDSGPVVLLLHGFPSSSRMFRDLIPRLSDAYHVIAPDYPAFGHSAVPDRSAFGYTFDHLADVVDGLLGQLGIGKFAIYVMDFGARSDSGSRCGIPSGCPRSSRRTRRCTPNSRGAGGPPWASTGRTGPPRTARPHAPTWTLKGCAASTCTASRTPR